MLTAVPDQDQGARTETASRTSSSSSSPTNHLTVNGSRLGSKKNSLNNSFKREKVEKVGRVAEH